VRRQSQGDLSNKLTADKLKNSETLWIKSVQTIAFVHELSFHNQKNSKPTPIQQGPKLRLTGRQCDQNFKTGCQQATNLLSPWHLRFQGKRAFFKRKHKAPMDNCSKTKRRFYNRHIYPAPYCFSSFSQYGYCGRKHDVAKS